MSTRDQAVLWLNGKKAPAGSLTAGGGNVLLSTPQHKLDGPEHQTADDTTTLDATTTEHGLLPKLSGDADDVLRGDGSWGVASVDPSPFLLRTEGGQDDVKAHGSLGATPTFDPTDGNVHTGTLTADCTVTVAAPSGSGQSTLLCWITQDSTPRTLAFAPTGGSFQWDGGVTPTLPSSGTFRVLLERIPGTTNDWVGNLIGSAAGSALTVKDEGSSLDTGVTSIDFTGAGVTATNTGHAVTVNVPVTAHALDDLSDVTLTSPAVGNRLLYSGTAWINDAGHDRPLMDGLGNVVTDAGTGEAIVAYGP